MDITKRQQQILSEIIRFYIKTGEPVGSKSLKESISLNISAATIRNEMSELAELGLLQQPHTSAGRIPSALAYRLYVDALMQPYELSSSDKKLIDSMLPDNVSNPDQLLNAAADALASLTSCAALSTTPSEEGAAVKTVQLIPTGGYSAIVILLTTGGIMRSAFCKTAAQITPELAENFMNLVRQEFLGLPLSKFQPALLQTLAAGALEPSLVFAPLLSALFDAAREAGETELRIGGEANLLAHRDLSGETAVKLIKLLENPRKILMMLENQIIPLNVLIGDESGYPGLLSSSLIIAKYDIGNRQSGKIGIIGPTRMPYDRLIPSLKYFADSIGKLFSEFLDDCY